MARINQTVKATFTDAQSGMLGYAPDLVPVKDDRNLANHIQVNSPSGVKGRTGSGVYVDTASKGDYGTIVETIESQTEQGGERQAIAEYAGYLRAQPKETVEEITPLPQVNPEVAWAAILGLEVSDAIALVRFAGSSPKTYALNVDGFRFKHTQERGLEVQIKTSPRDTRTYMVADHATLGLADSGNLAGP